MATKRRAIAHVVAFIACAGVLTQPTEEPGLFRPVASACVLDVYVRPATVEAGQEGVSMRISVVFCAVALACTSCLADSGEAAPPARGVHTEDIARHVASVEHRRLQAWCAEDGRTGSDVALRVIDAREPAEEQADVLCDEILATVEPDIHGATTEEAVGEAQQGLTPLGLGCAAAGVALAFGGIKFCREHPQVKNCAEKFAAGSVFGLVCTIFF